MVSTGIADVAEPAYLGRTMALQSSVAFAAGVLAVAALAGPLAVGFKEFSPRKSGV